MESDAGGVPCKGKPGYHRCCLIKTGRLESFVISGIASNISILDIVYHIPLAMLVGQRSAVGGGILLLLDQLCIDAQDIYERIWRKRFA